MKPGPGSTWGRLTVTEKGRARACELRADAAVTPERLRTLREIRATVSHTTFADLLREIYRRYPDYAVRSVFERGEDR